MPPPLAAQHRHGTDACGAGRDELIGQAPPLAELFESNDHRINVIDHDTARAGGHDHRLEQETSAPLMPDPPDCRGGRALRERNNRSGRPGKGRNPIDV
jgi:hypothetical protein